MLLATFIFCNLRGGGVAGYQILYNYWLERHLGILYMLFRTVYAISYKSRYPNNAMVTRAIIAASTHQQQFLHY